MNKKKLQRLLKVFTPDKTLPDLQAFDASVEQLKTSLKDKITVKTLDDVNAKIENFRKSISLQPIKDSLAEIENSFADQLQTLYTELEQNLSELQNADEGRNQELTVKISDLQGQITDLETSFKVDFKKIKKTIPDLTDLEDRLSEMTLELSSRITTLEEEEPQEIKDWTDTIEKVRKELLSRISQIGGGSMNRHINFNGTDFLTKYTDINYKAGTNVTFTVANNNATKMVDVTISATGGGGGGTVRVITNISTSQSALGASGTDYVYLCTGTLTLTMPDATAGNTNLYTVKNVGTGVVTINTTSSQTIDNNLTIVMPLQYTSVDLISDTANWNIT